MLQLFHLNCTHVRIYVCTLSYYKDYTPHTYMYVCTCINTLHIHTHSHPHTPTHIPTLLWCSRASMYSVSWFSRAAFMFFVSFSCLAEVCNSSILMASSPDRDWTWPSSSVIRDCSVSSTSVLVSSATTYVHSVYVIYMHNCIYKLCEERNFVL